jgi:hypothetical protein
LTVRGIERREDNAAREGLTSTPRHHTNLRGGLRSAAVLDAAMANPRHDGDLICAAARDGDMSHVSALLARGVPPDARESQFGSTPLHWSGQARCVRTACALRACMRRAARGGETERAASAAGAGWRAAAHARVGRGNFRLRRGSGAARMRRGRCAVAVRCAARRRTPAHAAASRRATRLPPTAHAAARTVHAPHLPFHPCDASP